MLSIATQKYIRQVIALLGICSVFAAGPAQAKKFDRIVMFGSSLSDSGNAFVLLSDPNNFGDACGPLTPSNVPPYDTLDDLLIPDGTYARGGHHVTNGATWIEQLALGDGLSGNTRPALRNPGTQASNYAVGGARANDYPCRFNLSDELNAYLSDFPSTSDTTLVAIEMGGNDVRDALANLPADPTPVLAGALANISSTIQTLYSQGARKFLLLNVPAVGYAPAVRMLDAVYPGTADAANYLAAVFNQGLVQMQNGLNQALPGIDVRTVDLFALTIEIMNNPSSFGITNITDACVTPNIPPFTCTKPDSYFFWDGIHPTRMVHNIIAQRAAEVLMSN